MLEIWEKEFTKPEVEISDGPSVNSLAENFLEIENDTKLKLIQSYFVEKCVDKVAKTMALAVLKHVPETSQFFQGEPGIKYLTGELGAMIIEGYIAARLSFGSLPGSHTMSHVPAQDRDRISSLVEKRWSDLEIEETSTDLNELLAELVTVRLNMQGF